MEEAKRSELPVDIIVEVLLRLPAKFLCRFRCVCKAWRDLIADPAFVAAQRSRAGPHLVAVFFGASTRCWSPVVQVMDMDGNVVRKLEVRVLGKGDGNVLGMLHAMIIDLEAGRAFTIGTDTPLETLFIFGRTALSGAFKVICLSGAFKVATIMDGGAEPLTWRQRSAPPFAINCHPEKRATANGIVYFMPRFYEDDATSNSGLGNIAAFDLESEEWKVINGPAFEIQEKIQCVTLTELKGCLGVVQLIGNYSPFVYEPNDDHYHAAVIWLLVDLNKSAWVKEYIPYRCLKPGDLLSNWGPWMRAEYYCWSCTKFTDKGFERLLYSTTLAQRHLQSSGTT